MKTNLIALIAVLAVCAGSLNAQVGPPRKPGDPDYPPGTRPGGATKPAAKPTPGPGIPSAGPKPQVKPQPVPVKPVVRNVPPSAPVTSVAPPRSVGPGNRPVFPTVRKQVLPGSPSIVVRKPGIVNPPGPGLRFDPRALRSVLSLAPRVLVRPPAPRPAPSIVVPGTPRALVRYYDRTRNVVVVPADNGQSTELPYIAVPLLFASGSADLLDQTAADDLQSLASALLEIYAQDQDARFVIEGHTSADGDAADNMQLSKDRAGRIYASLVSRYGVPAAILSIKGYGASYADYPNGNEAQMQLDRRVLVVRTK